MAARPRTPPGPRPFFVPAPAAPFGPDYPIEWGFSPGIEAA